MSTAALSSPTAMSLACRFKGELRNKMVQLGNLNTFRDWFIAAYWDELPNEELTADKIEAAMNYLQHSKD